MRRCKGCLTKIWRNYRTNNTIIEMKNALEGLNSIITEAEE